MAQAYSQDLRDRVIDAGTSARAAAERFGIGVATAIVWVRRAREGERTARRQGQPKRSKLDAHGDYLLALIEAEPDITLPRCRSGCGARPASRRRSAPSGPSWTERA